MYKTTRSTLHDKATSVSKERLLNHAIHAFQILYTVSLVNRM